MTISLVLCSLIRIFACMKQRTEEEYYIESKRIRSEVLLMAEALKDNPIRSYLEKAEYLGWRPVAGKVRQFKKTNSPVSHRLTGFYL